jgi:hypothetical protein
MTNSKSRRGIQGIDEAETDSLGSKKEGSNPVVTANSRGRAWVQDGCKPRSALAAYCKEGDPQCFVVCLGNRPI